MARFNRRQFLAAMGLGTGSLFLPSLSRADDAPPLRFLLFAARFDFALRFAEQTQIMLGVLLKVLSCHTVVT